MSRLSRALPYIIIGAILLLWIVAAVVATAKGY